MCDDWRVLQHGVPLFLTLNFDLRAHVENLGHGVAGCLGVRLTPRRCCGFLTKRGGRVKTWRRRWFLFDMDHRRLAYYTGEEHHDAEHTLKFLSVVTVCNTPLSVSPMKCASVQPTESHSEFTHAVRIKYWNPTRPYSLHPLKQLHNTILNTRNFFPSKNTEHSCRLGV